MAANRAWGDKTAMAVKDKVRPAAAYPLGAGLMMFNWVCHYGSVDQGQKFTKTKDSMCYCDKARMRFWRVISTFLVASASPCARPTRRQ